MHPTSLSVLQDFPELPRVASESANGLAHTASDTCYFTYARFKGSHLPRRDSTVNPLAL